MHIHERVSVHELSGFEFSIVNVFSTPFSSSVVGVSVHELSGFEFGIVNLFDAFFEISGYPFFSVQENSRAIGVW